MEGGASRLIKWEMVFRPISLIIPLNQFANVIWDFFFFRSFFFEILTLNWLKTKLLVYNGERTFPPSPRLWPPIQGS